MEGLSSHSIAWKMLMNVVEFLDSFPYHEHTSISEWADETYDIWKTFRPYVSKKEYSYGKMILLGLLQQYMYLGNLKKQEKEKTEETEETEDTSLKKRKEAIERIRSAPQVEQRTENWYKESLLILSGSQYATILKPGRTRGQLVLEKAGITKRETGGSNVVLSPQLNPFMWGIRFEPVVKQLYELFTNTKVVELGRLRHQTNPRLGASPDGLVIHESGGSLRIGRFVEFKAPVTRQIFNKVPEEYNVQMQIQMEVGDVDECDYLEVKFHSIYKNLYIESTPTPTYEGNIFIVEKDETLRYAYSPIHDMEWKPSLEENEQILEIIPWYTNEWYLTTVQRSREWYDSVKSKEEDFWRDVIAAKEGTWTLPESSRKPKEKTEKAGKTGKAEKAVKYAFVDSENENPS